MNGYALAATSLKPLVALAALASVLANAAPNDPPSAPVTVVNRTVNPVPVAGSVQISGTADVNVKNASIPVTQSGTWSIGISNTPNVWITNPALPVQQSGTWNVNVNSATPIAVQSRPRPFQRALSITLVSSVAGVVFNESFTVPPDKRLVIEHVSALMYHLICTGCNDDTVSNLSLSLETTVDQATGRHYLPVASVNHLSEEIGQGATSNYQFVVSERVSLYADPGSTVTASIRRKFTGYNGKAVVTLSGQLVDP